MFRLSSPSFMYLIALLLVHAPPTVPINSSPPPTTAPMNSSPLPPTTSKNSPPLPPTTSSNSPPLPTTTSGNSPPLFSSTQSDTTPPPVTPLPSLAAPSYFTTLRYGGAPLNVNGSKYKRFAAKQAMPSTDVLHGRPYCPQLDLSATSSLDGSWYRDAAKHYFFEPDACRLRRLNSQQAAACLATVGNLSFIGDSIMRYQYLTFLSFLSHGYYSDPYDDATNNLADMTTWAGEPTDFYPQAAVLIRSAGSGNVTYKVHKVHARVIEEWFYTQHSVSLATAGSAAAADLTMQCFVIYDWPTFVQTGVAGFQRAFTQRSATPRLVVYNQGIHWANKTDLAGAIDAIKTVLQGADAIMGSIPVRRLFATTTTPTWDAYTPLLSPALEEHDWSRFDIRSIIRAGNRQNLSMTWNPSSVHFLPVVYEQFNDYLLNVLCPP